MSSHRQTTDGQSYTTGYAYNLAGALIGQIYPSGRVFRNELDSNGDLAIVRSGRCLDAVAGTDGSCTNRAWLFEYGKHFSYTAAGAVTSMRLGNGLWESTQFNSRLQPVQIGLGTSVASQNLLRLNYDYGTDDNNGNVLSQTITVPAVGQTPGFTAVQSYSYDSLNRLKSAVENVQSLSASNQPSGNISQSWKQTYSFDRYGNRNFDEANTTTLPKNCGTPPNQIVCPADVPIVNPTISTANNRLSSTGWQYDAAGNTTADPEGRTFIYDAENKQVQVTNSSGVVGQYFYNGDGLRIKKVVPSTGETTVFVYDAGAKLIAEYSTIVEPTATAKTSYLTNDHLGSPRILTDANGNVISRRDFHPFGEEIYTTQRTQGLGYMADNIRQKFTSYERDIEIDLDFAEARYYNPKHGRFTTADEPFVGQDFVNPQTINLYTYTSNNPINRVDPDGHRWYTRDIDIDGQMTRQLVWVNPNDDGSYTAPEGEGWQAFIPTDDNRTFALGIDGGRKVIYLGENADGSPYIGRALWTGRVDSADEDIITAVSLVAGSWSIAKSIFGRAFVSWAAKQSVKTLTSAEISAIGEKALAEFLKNEGKATFETSLGRRIVDNLVRTSDDVIANESKVGRVGMKAFVRNQILKDAELLERGEISAAAWHFFKSPKTGKIGPTPAVRKLLEEKGIQIIIQNK